jgi:hypothetical protein
MVGAMRANLMVLIVCALAVYGCYGDHVHDVVIRNQTAASYSVVVVFADGSGFASAVPPSAIGFASDPGVGPHADRYVVFDESCRQVADGPIDGDSVGLTITAEKVTFEPRPSWVTSASLRGGADCGALSP